MKLSLLYQVTLRPTRRNWRCCSNSKSSLKMKQSKSKKRTRLGRKPGEKRRRRKGPSGKKRLERPRKCCPLMRYAASFFRTLGVIVLTTSDIDGNSLLSPLPVRPPLMAE